MALITELWAWVVSDGPDEEGILALTNPVHGNLPLIGSDQARIESFRAVATDSAQRLGLPLRLVRFSQMEVVEIVEPLPQKRVFDPTSN